MKTREGHEIHRQLSEISVELAGEAERTRDATHDPRDERIQIGIRGLFQLELTKTNVVQSLYSG